MKRFIKRVWMLMAMLCVTIAASAYDFEVDGIRYTITSFTGLTVNASSVTDEFEGELTIPNQVVFSGKTLSVKIIDADFASNNCKITSLMVESGISEIKSRAFYGCTNLTTVTLPESVNTIGSSVFYGCTNLASITFPESIKTIGSGAFVNCTKLSNFEGNGIEEMGDGVFSGCIALEHVKLISLAELPGSSFSSCASLIECDMPMIVSIGEKAFSGCTSLVAFDVPPTVKSIANNAFEYCTSLVDFVFPDNVKSMGSSIFNGCSGLKSITIGAGITKLESLGCNTLETLIISDSPNTLCIAYTGSRSFYDETQGRPGYSIDGIEYSPCSPMFKDYTNLKEVYIGRNLYTESYHYKFKVISSKSCYSCYYVPNPPFSESSIEKLTIGSLVTKLRMYGETESFGNRTYLNGEWNGSFQNCVNLSCVEFINDSISTCLMTNKFFAGCNSLKKLNLPYRVRTIGSNAMLNCSALEEISLGCYHIGENALLGCDKLGTICLTTSDPPSYYEGFSSNLYISTIVYVPRGSLERYQKSYPWSNFWNLTEFPTIGAESIVLSSDEITLIIGETHQLEAAILPEDATDKTVIWTSSEPEVAEVSNSGEIKAISIGSAIITATCGDVSAQCNVVVQETTGIKSIVNGGLNVNSKIDIYTVQGVQIRSACDINDLNSLQSGIYIVIQNGHAYKVHL